VNDPIALSLIRKSAVASGSKTVGRGLTRKGRDLQEGAKDWKGKGRKKGKVEVNDSEIESKRGGVSVWVGGGGSGRVGGWALKGGGGTVGGVLGEP